MEDDDIKRLSGLFEKLGAKDPDDWASSQISEGTPQLARFLFLRQAWRNIVSSEDPSWIEAAIREFKEDPSVPYGGVGWALGALQAKGATSEELTHLVRGMQAELLFCLCYLLEDPGDLEADVSDTSWGFFLLDENDQPMQPVTGLHESVLEMDPSGHEMRLSETPGK